MNDYELVEAVKKKLTQDIAIMSQKMQIINDAKANNRAVVDPRELATLNQSINSTADPKILALMLEAKVEGHSRTDRREIDPNDRYEPFVISNDGAFENLLEIIKEKQIRQEPFRFDFVNIRKGHATPVQITSDGAETDFFNIDASGGDISKNFGDFASFIETSFNVCRYNGGSIQTIERGCGVFAIQILNTLNNMSLEDKRRDIHGNISNLDPRFFKITQSLSHLPEKNLGMVISKKNKPRKILEDHLGNFTIGVLDTRTQEVKKQNRAFDEKYFKYLSRAQNLIDNKSDQEIIEIIRKRSTPSEEKNTAPPATYLAAIPENIRKATEDIESVSDCVGIRGIVTKFSPADSHILINNSLGKLNFIINDTVLPIDIVQEVNHIVRLFPESTRSNFLLPTIKLLSKVNSIDGVKRLTECFSQDDRTHLVGQVSELISRVNSIDGVLDLIKCFKEEDRGEFLPSIKSVLSKISETKDLRDIIRYDNSLVQDVQEPLRKAIINGEKIELNTFIGMTKDSPETERHHFLDNIKAYINNLVNVNDKALNLSLLVQYLSDDVKEKFHEDVSKLMSDDQLNHTSKEGLKFFFKNFDFDSRKKPEGIIVGPVSEAKDVAPPLPLSRPKEGGEGKNL